MIAKLIVEGKEFPIEIQDPELQKLLAPQKKTGYERVERKDAYYYVNVEGDIVPSTEYGICFDSHYDGKRYDVANYYSNKTVAKNNARADKLMRQLRRFTVEHRKNELNWSITAQNKYYICYDCWDNKIDIDYVMSWRNFGAIYFDTEGAAEAALSTFKDELTWYFTEYKDSL